MSNDTIINVQTKKKEWTIEKIAFNKSRINILIYHTYLLLYCKKDIQMTSNDSIIIVETKNNRENKMTKLHSIHLEWTL